MELFRNKLLLAILTLIVMLNLNCGGGGGSDDENTTTSPTTTKSIDSTGGTIIHLSGLNVEFPEGSLSDATDISIQEVSLPSPLPDGIQAISKAFKISPEGLKLNKPAIVKFQPAANSTNETVDLSIDGVFRWDGVEWGPVGCFHDDGNIYATTNGFSTFVRIEIIHPQEWKKFVFLNKGNDAAFLMVWTSRPYEGPTLYPRLVVPSAAADHPPERHIWLPLGCYEFCYEWWIYNPYEFKKEEVHNFEGDAIWQHCLDDQTGLASGESVWIDTTYGDYEGPCDRSGNQLWQWQASGRGDHQGCDVTNTMGSSTPDPTLAEEGFVAICWDGETVCNPTFDCDRYGAWCTYKDLSLGTCPAKESTAYMHVAAPSPTEF